VEAKTSHEESLKLSQDECGMRANRSGASVMIALKSSRGVAFGHHLEKYHIHLNNTPNTKMFFPKG